MKILFITHYSEMLGANRCLLALLIYLQQRTNYVTLVLLPSEGEFSNELRKYSIPFIVCNIYPAVYDKVRILDVFKGYLRELLTLLTSISLYFKLRKDGFEIIHSNSSVINAGIYLSLLLKKTHIWHFREFADLHYNFSYNWGKKYQTRLWNSGINTIVTVSNSLKKYYSSILRRPKLLTIYDGVNVPNNLSKNILTKDFFNLALVGVIHPGKHQDIVLKALYEIIHTYSIENVHLHIYGNFANESYKHFIEDLINRLHIQKFITFHGYQQNIFNSVTSCQIGILASEYEAFGRVTIEYMAWGLIAIESNSGANKELIKDGINGFLFDLNDPISLANKIVYVINNYQNMHSILNQAYLTSLEFSEDKNAIKIVELYDKILKQN